MGRYYMPPACRKVKLLFFVINGASRTPCPMISLELLCYTAGNAVPGVLFYFNTSANNYLSRFIKSMRAVHLNCSFSLYYYYFTQYFMVRHFESVLISFGTMSVSSASDLYRLAYPSLYFLSSGLLLIFVT